MSKARQLADNGAATPNRNMVINGAMQVAQRGTSSTGIGADSGYFTVDRIGFGATGSAGRLTMTQASDGPVGFANCIKLDCTTADTSIAAGEILNLRTVLEGQNLQRINKGVTGAKETTVSFYVKASGSFTFVCELYDGTNTRHVAKSFATTTSWNRIELNIPADVDDGSSPYADSNAGGLYLYIWLHAGSNYTSGTLQSSSWANVTDANRAVGISSFFSSTDNEFFITGLQYEVGSSATPFEHKSYAQDLIECQRYFRRLPTDSDATAYTGIANGLSYHSSSAFITLPLQPPMRTAVSGSINGTLRATTAGNADCTVTGVSVSAAYNSRDCFFGDFTTDANQTTGRAVTLARENDADASLDLSAEL